VVLGRSFADPGAGASVKEQGAWANLLTAQELGLIDALVSARLHDQWDAEPSAAERLRLANLRSEVQSDVSIANAPTYNKELAGALRWAGLLKAEFPSRPLIVRNQDAGDSAFNAETKCLLFKFARNRGSIKRGHEGKPLKSSSIEGTISTFFAFCDRLANQEHLVSPGDEPNFQQLKKRGRSLDGPAGARKVEDPLRAQHLRIAFADSEPAPGAQPALERSSPLGRVRHAAL
jgi:hypothetical protein